MGKRTLDENVILESLASRPGIDTNSELLKDMVKDAIVEIRSYLNYEDEEELPVGCEPIIKQLVLVRFSQNGAEGIQSESHSGVSTTYLTDLPKAVLRQIRRYRRLPR